MLCLGALCWAACGKDPGWLEALDSVEPLVTALPAAEIGCLYYSRERLAFVDPRGVPDAVAHFGRPGGVLPRIADAP